MKYTYYDICGYKCEATTNNIIRSTSRVKSLINT